MKKTILLMLGLVAGTASFAQQTPVQTPTTDTPQTHLVITPDQKIKLFVQPLATSGQLSLLDAQGHVLYGANVSLKKGIGRQFDITGLPVGTYRLLIKANNETVTKTFVVQPVPNETFVMQQA
ncbi:MAG: T9SS type A sorting domain-containing protein [Spirosoma sp.]|nr:T9SS type A sorting domain-containing protein [Spirosoma sp.]